MAFLGEQQNRIPVGRAAAERVTASAGALSLPARPVQLMGEEEELQMKPAIQLEKGIPINDDPELEREADEMGARALQRKLMAAGAPVQFAKPYDAKRQTIQEYAAELKEEAEGLIESPDRGRTNVDYLTGLVQGIKDAGKMGSMLGTVTGELYKAIKTKTYKPKEELRYAIGNLEGSDSLSEEQTAAVQQRIDAKNAGEDLYHLHLGVGNTLTMDLGVTFGGRGRGDARLQFFRDGSMKIVGHDNRPFF
jgi:hypothetical protein